MTATSPTYARSHDASDWDADDGSEVADYLTGLDDNDTGTNVVKLGKAPDDIVRVEFPNLATLTTSDTVSVYWGSLHNFVTMTLVPYDAAAGVDTTNNIIVAVDLIPSPAVFTLTSGFIAALHDLGSDTWAARITENGGIGGDVQLREVDSDLTEAAGAFVDLASDIAASATVTAEFQKDVQLASDIEANATTDTNAQISKPLASSIEANATVAGDIQVDEQLAASVSGNATVTAALSLVEAAIEEVAKGGGWLPKEELRKLLKIRRSLDRKIKEDREKKDEDKREQRRELERIFNRINGIEEVSEELAELVEPFVQAVPETAEALEAQPQLPSVNFEALAAQVETADRLRQLADRLEQISQDEEEVITLLLLS